MTLSLTADEAATRVGLNPKTLRQKLRDGVIRGRLEHGRWVVEEQDLKTYAHLAGYDYTHSTIVQEANRNSQPSAVGPAPASPIGDAPAGNPADAGTESVTVDSQDRSAEVRPAGAWLLLAVGDNRAFGSNDGYEDEPESHYRWDDTVANHAQIRAGDAVVLWDKKSSIGASVIHSIETERKTKPLYSCPHCGKAHIKARKTKEPRYRCFECGRNFDVPVTIRKEVLGYTARYEASWVDLDGFLDGRTLRNLCVSPKSQLSLRALKWEEFQDAVSKAGGPELMTVLLAAKSTINGGHTMANVRVRIGQGVFRRGLLATIGPLCAFTGPTHAAALEAAHLYSYARAGEHREHGGLLMRRDLHRLFDLGFIAVNPRTLKISVSASLTEYAAYRDLDGRALTVRLRGRQREWLREHWAEHRG